MNPLHVQLLIKVLCVVALIGSLINVAMVKPANPWLKLANFLFAVTLSSLSILTLAFMVMLT